MKTTTIISCLLVAVSCKDNAFDPDASTTTSESSSSSIPLEIPPAKETIKLLPVCASRLWNDYQENEVRADQRYKYSNNGHIALFVKGYVNSINKDLSDKSYLSLNTSNMFLPVRAEMVSPKTAAKINKGDMVYLWCEGAGEMMVPLLKDCILIYWTNGDADQKALNEMVKETDNFKFELVSKEFRK